MYGVHHERMVAGDGRTEKLLRPDGVDDREVPEICISL